MRRTTFHTFHKGDRVEFLDSRFYVAGEDKDGNTIFYPSVTTILDMYPKGYGFNEFLKKEGYNADVIARETAESGSAVHNAVERMVAGETLAWDDSIYNEQEWRGIMGFLDFCERFKPKFLGSEMTVLSHEYKYAGTLDAILELNGEMWLIDIKFTNDLWRTSWLQLAAYHNAVHETNDEIKIDRVGILHLKAKTRTEGTKGAVQGIGWKLVDPPDPVDKLFQIFLKIHGIYYYENPNPAPKNYIYPTEIKIPKECLI